PFSYHSPAPSERIAVPLLTLPRLKADELLIAAALCAAPWLASAQPVSGAAAPTSVTLLVPAAQPGAPLPRELGKPEDDVEVTVDRYQIDGLSAPTPEAVALLTEATAPYVGGKRSFEDLVNATAAVTRVLQRDLGYYVGFAYLPEQAAGTGVVHIQVLEGRLDEVTLNWPQDAAAAPPVRRDIVEAHLSALRPGSILRVRDVERVAFLINDLRGISTRFEIGPGRELGTASLIVTPRAESRVITRVELDTLGSRYTGRGRLGGVVGVASPTGRGDALSISSLTSLTGGLGYGGISYALPVGTQGLKLGASLARVHYEIDEDDYPQQLNGHAVAGGLTALYPMVRTRNLNVFGQAGFEDKRFTDRQDGVPARRKRSHDWQFSLLGDFRDQAFGGAINTFEVNWLQGRMRYEDGEAPAGLKRNFGKATLAYSRLQNLVSNRLQFYGRYKAQLSGTSLDASERFAVGGPSSVRAFAPGEASADTGHVLTGELRFLPPEAWFGRVSRELVFTAFYDWGHAKFSHDADLQVAGRDNTATLSAHGLGVIWERPNDMAFRLNLAWRGAGDAVADPIDHSFRANAVLSKTF
ncbi:MAG: ShlB/FhaC/HecB family hemolysin secretion/activation protein, partial [Rubrivivax sp.]